MRVLLPFFDDSSLIFATAMSRALRVRGHDITVAWTSEGRHSVSPRQLEIHLGGEPFEVVDNMIRHVESTKFDAVMVARLPFNLRFALLNPIYRMRKSRPCYIAFQPGLEFTVARGFRNRQFCDAIFLNTRQQSEAFEKRANSRRWQHISFGHPYYQTPQKTLPLENDGDIFFFAQAISPITLKSRLHILNLLNTLATIHPDRKVFLKLRHLPNENRNHAHKEQFAYTELLDDFFPSRAPNFELTACNMSEAIRQAGYGITCTSTAAMDCISAGLPVAVYTDYVENYLDPLARPMSKEFESSELITPLDDLLNLRFRRANPHWLQDRFRGEDLFQEIEQVVEAFPTRCEVEPNELKCA